MTMAAVMTFSSCGENDSKETVLGPEETVEIFWRSVAGGDLEGAKSLCDTVSMAGFLDNYKEKWEQMVQADSSASAIAAGLLSSSEMTIVKNIKEGDARTIIFAIETETGLKKEKSATVKKEEGIWKVEKMTDVK